MNEIKPYVQQQVPEATIEPASNEPITELPEAPEFSELPSASELTEELSVFPTLDEMQSETPAGWSRREDTHHGQYIYAQDSDTNGVPETSIVYNNDGLAANAAYYDENGDEIRSISPGSDINDEFELFIGGEEYPTVYQESNAEYTMTIHYDSAGNVINSRYSFSDPSLIASLEDDAEDATSVVIKVPGFQGQAPDGSDGYEDVTFDLSEYEGLDDPQLARDLESAITERDRAFSPNGTGINSIQNPGEQYHGPYANVVVELDYGND